jgi:hypothetical protein
MMQRTVGPVPVLGDPSGGRPVVVGFEPDSHRRSGRRTEIRATRLVVVLVGSAVRFRTGSTGGRGRVEGDGR